MAQELSRDSLGNLTGNLKNNSLLDRHVNETANFARAKLAQRALARVNIPFSSFRVWDAFATLLPATGATDDLGLYTGTAGSGAGNKIKTGDVKTLTATRYARVEVAIPDDYEDGESLNVVVLAGMDTTVAGTSATVDVECYQVGVDGTVGSDICATAAQSINNTTYAEKTFTITADDLVAGDKLDIRLAVSTVDVATGTAVIGVIAAVWLACDRR